MDNKLYEPSTKDLHEWQAWLASRPPAVKAIAERFPPWELFKLKKTGQKGSIYSVNENGTVTAIFPGEWNQHWQEANENRKVFGIDPDDLEPCEVEPGMRKH